MSDVDEANKMQSDWEYKEVYFRGVGVPWRLDPTVIDKLELDGWQLFWVFDDFMLYRRRKDATTPRQLLEEARDSALDTVRLMLKEADGENTGSLVGAVSAIHKLRKDRDRNAEMLIAEEDLRRTLADRCIEAAIERDEQKRLADLRGEEVARLADELGRTKAERDRLGRDWEFTRDMLTAVGEQLVKRSWDVVPFTVPGLRAAVDHIADDRDSLVKERNERDEQIEQLKLRPPMACVSCENLNLELADELEAIRPVYAIAKGMRSYPVPFDVHLALVDAVDYAQQSREPAEHTEENFAELMRSLTRRSPCECDVWPHAGYCPARTS